MKSTIKFLLITALVAVIGFSMAACDDKIDDGGNGNGDDDKKPQNTSLEGTWVDSDGVKLVLNNGNFTYAFDNEELFRGTYSTSGTNGITMVTTGIHGALYEGDMGIKEDQWYTKQQLLDAFSAYLIEEFEDDLTEEEIDELIEEFTDKLEELFITEIGTYSITGNELTLILDGETEKYTKQQ